MGLKQNLTKVYLGSYLEMMCNKMIHTHDVSATCKKFLFLQEMTLYKALAQSSET